MTAPPLRIREVQIYPLEIPLRLKFEHAAATRSVADPVLVRLIPESPYGEISGWGETLARKYVTGETADSVINTVGKAFATRLLEFRPRSFAEALEFVDGLPNYHADRLVLAARAAVELAILDLAGKAFARKLTDVAGWVDQPGFQLPGSAKTCTYSGIAAGSGGKLKWGLRLQRWYGLRDFKLKVAVPGWEDKLRATHRILKRALTRGQVTLRVDANGGWNLADARAAAETLQQYGVCALEQPLPPQADENELGVLADELNGTLDICADESLRTPADAQKLLRQGVRLFNIRIAKCGGLLPSLRIADTVIRNGGQCQLGCLVGETSLLTAAGAAFLQLCPNLRFAEGAFGRFLLAIDIVKKPLRFGHGGRLRFPTGPGLGVNVDLRRVEQLAASVVHPIRL